MSKKNTVRLTESYLKKVISESVKKVLSQQFPVDPAELVRTLYKSDMDIEEFIHRFEKEWDLLRSESYDDDENEMVNHLPPLAVNIRKARTFKTYTPKEADVVECGMSGLSKPSSIHQIDGCYGVGYELHSDGTVEYFVRTSRGQYAHQNIYIDDSNAETIIPLLV